MDTKVQKDERIPTNAYANGRKEKFSRASFVFGRVELVWEVGPAKSRSLTQVRFGLEPRSIPWSQPLAIGSEPGPTLLTNLYAAFGRIQVVRLFFLLETAAPKHAGAHLLRC